MALVPGVDAKPRPLEIQPTFEPEAEPGQEVTMKIGLVITSFPTQYPNVQIEAVQGEANDELTKFVSKTAKIDLTKFVNTAVFSEDDKMLLQQLRKLMSTEVNRYLNRNSPFSGIWENIIQQHTDELPEETKHLINEYFHPKLTTLIS